MKIVVIGGGVAGLSIGWRLARSGCEVVVLERAQPGRGATWASGGMIAAAAENAGLDSDEAKFAHHAAALWPAFAAEIEEHSNRPIHFRRDGSLIAALSADTLGALSSRATNAARILAPAEALRFEPLLNPDIAGALFADDDAQVDNRALGIALALAFVNAGGTLQVNESVVRLELENGRVAGARTPFALYEADAFVIAAGAWSAEIKGVPPEAVMPVMPVKGEMIALKAADASVLPIRLVWGDGVYLIPRHDRLFVGATVSREGLDTSITAGALDRLRTRACEVMPSLAGWDMVEHWAGLRPGSPDDLPIIGETAVSGLFIASGQYRNGILFAPAIADALHSLILERRQAPEIRAFDPKRFAGTALAGGTAVG